jgi:hypothetical protein
MGDRLTAAPATYTATFGIFRGLSGSSLGAPLNMSEAILLVARRDVENKVPEIAFDISVPDF